jgi:hypothetical protein
VGLLLDDDETADEPPEEADEPPDDVPPALKLLELLLPPLPPSPPAEPLPLAQAKAARQSTTGDQGLNFMEGSRSYERFAGGTRKPAQEGRPWIPYGCIG